MVLLKCIKEASRLRIKIISPGYLRSANCQFPKDIRVEGRFYECEPNHISLALIGRKHFYRIAKYGIRIITDNVSENTLLENDLKNNSLGNTSSEITFEKKLPKNIYTDDANDDCSICLIDKKTQIFVPCGHFYVCNTCSKNIIKYKNICPICRANITYTVTSDQIA